jgi:hypothetical protein
LNVAKYSDLFVCSNYNMVVGLAGISAAATLMRTSGLVEPTGAGSSRAGVQSAMLGSADCPHIPVTSGFASLWEAIAAWKHVMAAVSLVPPDDAMMVAGGPRLKFAWTERGSVAQTCTSAMVQSLP